MIDTPFVFHRVINTWFQNCAHQRQVAPLSLSRGVLSKRQILMISHEVDRWRSTLLANVFREFLLKFDSCHLIFASLKHAHASAKFRRFTSARNFTAPMLPIRFPVQALQWALNSSFFIQRLTGSRACLPACLPACLRRTFSANKLFYQMSFRKTTY